MRIDVLSCLASQMEGGSFCRESGRAVVGPHPLSEELCARVLVAGDGLAWLEYLPLAALGAPVGRA